MQFHILNENYTPVAVMDNDLPDAINFNNSKFHRFLTGSADFFDFETSKLHVDHNQLQVGYWVAFKYDYRDRLLYINEIAEAERDKMMTISSASSNLDLNNETKQPFSATEAKPFKWYFDIIMFDTGYEIGINEISNLTRKLSWENSMTIRSFIQSVATQFDNAELDYEVVLNSDFTIKKRLVHIKKKIGEVRDDIELRYGDNVKTVKRTTSINELCTAVRPVSKDDNDKVVNISSINDWQELDEKGNIKFFHKKGSNLIFAPQANARFGNRGHNVTGGGYTVHDFSYDKVSQNELFNRSHIYLKEHSVPAINYEVEGRTGAKIGDTVKIVDDGYTPELILSARVLEQVVSFDDATVEQATFGNYKALQSQISADLIAKMQQLAEENAPYKAQTLTTNGLTFKNSAGSTTLTARLYKGSKEIVPESYAWTINGVVISGNSEQHEITAENINGKAVVRWSAVINGVTVAFDEVTIQDVSDGAAGRGIKDKSSKWQLTTTTAQPTDTWSSTKWKDALQIATATNKYLWQIDRTTYTDDTTSDLITLSAVYGDTGTTGSTGQDGKPGKNGSDGINGTNGTNGADGKDALNLTLSNQAVTIPAAYDGSVQSYSGTGTRIDLTEGATVLLYDEKGVTAGTWKVSALATGITCGAIVDSGAYATVANHSGMTTDSAVIEYTIIGKRTNGANFTVKASQSFSKSKQGVVGVSSYTWIRYSANSNGASMTMQPGADTKYIGLYAGTRATAPTSNIDYTWSNYVGSNGSDGAKGDPTGVTKQATEPASAQRFSGMLWQYTGTASMSITGTTATPNAIYRWTSSAWELWYFYAANIQADAAFFNLLNVSSATVDNLGVNGAINANLINPTAGNMLTNSEFQSNGFFDGRKFSGTLSSYFSNANGFYQSSNGDSSSIVTFDSRSASADNSVFGMMFQDTRASAGLSYSFSVVGIVTAGTGFLRFRIYAINSSGATIGSSTAVDYSTNSWTTLKSENYVAPAGTAYIRYAVVGFGQVRLGATRVMLNKGTKVAPYTPSAGALTVTGDMIVDGAVSASKVSTPNLAAMSAVLGNVTAGTYTSWNFSDTGVYKYLNGVYLYDGHLRSISIENSTVTDPDKNLTNKSYLIRGSDVYGGMVTFFNNTITTSAKPNDLLKGSSFFSGSNQASVLDSSRDASGASALDIRSDNVRITGYASQTIPWTMLTDFSSYKVMFGRVNIKVRLTSGSSRNHIYLGTVPDQYKSPNGDMMLPAQAWFIDTNLDRHVQYNTDGSLHLLNPEPNTKYVFEVSYTL